jgi:hypothetical protein
MSKIYPHKSALSRFINGLRGEKGTFYFSVDQPGLIRWPVGMPRRARATVGSLCHHAEVFRKPEDYAAFRELLRAAADLVQMRALAYCLLPNHFHLALWPGTRKGDILLFWPRRSDEQKRTKGVGSLLRWIARGW